MMNVTDTIVSAATADPAREPTVVAVTVTSLLTPVALGSFFYPLVLAAIVRNRKEFASPYYTYLFSIGVCELLDLYYYGLFGSICILYGACPVSLTFNRIASAFCSWTLWYLEYVTDLIMAFDRFVAICFYKYYATFNTPKWAAAMIAAAWSASLALSMPVLICALPASFIVDEFMPNFENVTSDAVVLYNNVTLDILYVVLSIEALLYICCGVYMCYRWRATQTVSVGIRRAQRNLLVQSLLSIVLLSAGVILETNVQVLSVWANYVFAFDSQLIPMNRLFVTLALNSAIRAEVWQILRCNSTSKKRTKKTTKKNTIVPANNIVMVSSNRL